MVQLLQGEFRVSARKGKITASLDLEAKTKGGTVHRCDHRGFRKLDRLERLEAQLDEIVAHLGFGQRVELRHIGAGGEHMHGRAALGMDELLPGQDDAAHLLIRIQFIDCIAQVPEELGIGGIEFVRAVEDDNCVTFLLFNQDRFVAVAHDLFLNSG